MLTFPALELLGLLLGIIILAIIGAIIIFIIATIINGKGLASTLRMLKDNALGRRGHYGQSGSDGDAPEAPNEDTRL